MTILAACIAKAAMATATAVATTAIVATKFAATRCSEHLSPGTSAWQGLGGSDDFCPVCG